jgi:hypothetical protein
MVIRLGKAAGVIFFVLALLWCWYSVAANYDYDSLAGTYVLDGGDKSCILDLRADRTFVQEIIQNGTQQEVQGRWHRSGEAGVAFSNEFVRLSGQELNAAGEAHGEFRKLLGIFPTLTLAPLPEGPKFRRSLFHR